MSNVISNQADLERLCAELAHHEQIGLDTEFMRERTYFAQLCLVQISYGQQAVCVDTLAISELAPLAGRLAAPAARKILHAARQDLEVLWPLAGPLPNLFDTQVAAALTGLPAQVGYADLVARLLDHTLHKSQTRTDWSRRPLSRAQLEYALDDVRYLPALAAQLQARLEHLGRWSWFTEEMREFCENKSFQIDPEQAWRRLQGLQELDESRRRLARALGAWRERRAIRADRPRNWILPDAALHEIARAVPRTSGELDRILELPDGIRRGSGAQLLELIDSLQLPAQLPPLPPSRRPDPAQTEVVRRLGELTRQVARELAIAPELLATRREMERLAAGERHTLALSGWRREVIGERLVAAL